MKTRLFHFAGAALLLAAPAFAGQSTPAERAATRQLNLEAARLAQSGNQPSMPQIADASAQLPANSPPAAAPTARIESAAIADGAAPVTLSSLANPPSKISSANVLDSAGQTIGAVQRVEVTPEGTPTKVAVTLIGKEEKLVVLDANAVSYDPSKNEILARQSADQIKSLAG